MTTLACLVVAGAVAMGLTTALRLPSMVFAVSAGLALQALSAPVDPTLVREALLLASVFLMFSVGAETDRAQVATFRRPVVVLAVAHLAVTAGIAWALTQWLGLDARSAIYLSLALGGSSTLLVLELLVRRERVFEPVGRLVMGVTLMQDVLVLVALSILVQPSMAAMDVVEVVVELGVLASASWAIGRWAMPWLMVRSRLGEEERLLVALGLLFGFAGVAHLAGLPFVLGVYFAGTALSRFPVGSVVRGYITSFKDFFTVVFFVALGAILRVPRSTELVVELVFIASLLLFRPLLMLPVVRSLGFNMRTSIEAVTLLAHTGEVGLVVALFGMNRGLIDDRIVGMVALVSVATLSIVPWLSSDGFSWSITRRMPFPRIRRPDRLPSGHILLIGGGESGQALLDELGARGPAVVVVDDDPATVEALVARGIIALRGDGSDPSVLQAAGADEATAIVSTMRRLDDNARLLARFRDVPVLVRVFSEADAEKVRRWGGQPVVESEIAADAFGRWLDAGGHGASEGGIAG